MRGKIFIVGLLLGIFLLLNWASASKESLTYDESVHLKAGIEEWQTRIFSLDANNPPLIREIAALPVVLGIAPGRQYLPSRLTITLLGLTLALVVFKYAVKKFGWQTGLIALLLFVFEPSILAHSHYVTLDIGTALFFFLSFISAEKFGEKSSWKNAFLWGLFTGLAFASKITIIPTLSITFFILFLLKRKIWLKDFWKKLIFAAGIALLAVWATYFFTLAPIIAEREDSTRLSVKIINLAEEKNLPFLKNTILFLKMKPVPLGYFFASAKNGFIYNLSSHKTEFMGRFYPDNRLYFLPVILFLKLPLPLIILFLIGVIGVIGLIGQIGKIGKNGRFLLLPLALMILLFSFSNAPPRVRYLLPVFPFLIIIAAGGANWLWQRKLGKILVILGLLVYIGGTLFYFPHFITFTNASLVLADSNGDWGQGLITLKKYLETKDVKSIELSYFGTDNPENYGLAANRPFAEKFEDRCPLYSIKLKGKGERITAISLTNYYYCGYWQDEKFAKNKVKKIIGDSILIFEDFK